MLMIDLAALTPGEAHSYGAGYIDAMDDLADEGRRAAEAIAALEHELAEARKDAEYWRRVANPVAVPSGPTRTELERTRRELTAQNANHVAKPWPDVPTRTPADR
ncbi:hypothetical protein GCM10009749_35350 [Agromyces neolithicus]|uniref:Uncharacterized protein n=1 Tax=Agromyces neolithicus TaxID=269420 RepID=A0ABP4YKJ7_9MICO